MARHAARFAGVVVDTPLLDQCWRFLQAVDEFTVEKLLSKRSVEALAIPFSQGDCGSIWAVQTPTTAIQSRTF